MAINYIFSTAGTILNIGFDIETMCHFHNSNSIDTIYP